MVTVRLAVAVRPAPSVTVTVKVRGPLATVSVFQAYAATAPSTVCVDTTAPSTLSVNVDAPLAPVEARPTVVVPLTVAPSAGAVKEAVSGDSALPTVTGSVAVA